MSNISIRLPEELENKLGEEARRVHKKRSELAREAIADYLQRIERERFLADMVQAAKALYSDPEAVEEARQIQQDFDAVDNSIERLENEERAVGIDPHKKWWK